MPVLAFGMNHNSPIEIRERLAFNDHEIDQALQELREQCGLQEAMILSTCNRTEIYAASNDPTPIKTWLTRRHHLSELNWVDYSYHHQGLAAVRHVMRVASGLDSVILGEPQILGQMKTAFHIAREQGAVGTQLSTLFSAVFETSKHIRTATHIGRCPVSIAYVIAHLCNGFFEDLTTCNVLFIGAGTIVELIATHLKSKGIRQCAIANRTIARARALAAAHQGIGFGLDDIGDYLQDSDIIICATASETPILKTAMFEDILTQRQRPLLIADLSVPRNVEPTIANFPAITLYNIDDLRDIVNQNMNHRSTAAQQAESMIELYAENYLRKLRIHDANDIIRSYRNNVLTQRDDALEKGDTRVKKRQNSEAVLKNFARNFANKVMHQPTMTLRQAAYDGELALLSLAKDLFE